MNLNWTGKEDYDAILVCPPDGGRGYVHSMAMGASLMASLAEASRHGGDMAKASVEMDKAGWNGLLLQGRLPDLLQPGD